MVLVGDFIRLIVKNRPRIFNRKWCVRTTDAANMLFLSCIRFNGVSQELVFKVLMKRC